MSLWTPTQALRSEKTLSFWTPTKALRSGASRISLLYCLLLCILHPASFVFAQGQSIPLCIDSMLVPGTTYTFPGYSIPLSDNSFAAHYFSLSISADTTGITGWDDPCSLKVVPVFAFPSSASGETIGDTTILYGYDSGEPYVIFNDRVPLAEADSGWVVTGSILLHDYRQYQITVTDTARFTITERQQQ